MRKLVVFMIAVATTGPVLSAESYRVTVTRKEKDMYKIDGTKTFIQTRRCLELALGDDAVLVYEPGGADNKLLFNVGRPHTRPVECEVVRLLAEK